MNFTCFECGKTKSPKPDSIGTGYGRDENNNKICYECCAEGDRKRMIETGRITLYVTEEERPQPGFPYERPTMITITNWPGTLKFETRAFRRGRHNIGGKRLDVWFKGPDGKEWHGVHIGTNHQIIRCKRTKSAIRSY